MIEKHHNAILLTLLISCFALLVVILSIATQQYIALTDNDIQTEESVNDEIAVIADEENEASEDALFPAKRTYEQAGPSLQFSYPNGAHIFSDQFQQSPLQRSVYISDEPVFLMEGEQFFPVVVRVYEKEGFLEGESLTSYVNAQSANIATVDAEVNPEIIALNESGTAYKFITIDLLGGLPAEYIYIETEESVIVYHFSDLGKNAQAIWAITEPSIVIPE